MESDRREVTASETSCAISSLPMCEFGWHYFVNPLALVPGLRGIFYRVGNSIPPDLQRRVRGMYNVQRAEWQKPPDDDLQMALTVSFFTGKH